MTDPILQAVINGSWKMQLSTHSSFHLFLSLHQIQLFYKYLLDILDAYRDYLDFAELRYAELSISVHRETVE
jgi:hypothetical protein